MTIVTQHNDFIHKQKPAEVLLPCLYYTDLQILIKKNDYANDLLQF